MNVCVGPAGVAFQQEKSRVLPGLCFPPFITGSDEQHYSASNVMCHVEENRFTIETNFSYCQ